MLIALMFSVFSYAETNLIPIDFETKITTCISRELLWEQFELSLRDSEESWLWPNEDSTALGGGLLEDNEVRITYKTLFIDPTYTYRISNVVPLKTFTYSAVDGEHPFRGGATINLETAADGMSVLSWTGRYLTEPGDWIERRFFKSFSRGFFSVLDKNISDHEHLCD